MNWGNGQPEQGVSFQYLDACCQLIAAKTGKVPFSDWANADYIRLSSRLAHESDIQVSPNTLKRIFGKLKTSSRYYPQKATRDALARFVGYLHWDEFTEKFPLPVKPVELVSLPIQKTEPVKRVALKYMFLVTGAGILMICLAAFLYFPGTPKTVTQAGLICSNPSGEAPHSAVFQLSNTGGVSGKDQFTIAFGDNKLSGVSPQSTTVHFYEMPGRYYAVLKNHDTPLDTATVYLQSNGWDATVSMAHDTNRVYPVKSRRDPGHGALKVTANDVYLAGADTNRTFLVHFSNTKPLHINGDNFELLARVKTSQARPGVRCSQVFTQVFGDRAKHAFLLMKPDCAAFIQLQHSEIFVTGQFHDFRNIGADFTNAGEYRLLVRNREAKIIINGREVHRTTYQQPLGELFGLRISFSGIGEINRLYVKDLNTGVVFHDGFPAPE